MLGEPTWNPVWDEIFRARPWGKYPKEELIRFVARNYYQVPDRKAVRFLDLGCGFGSATWYLAREGFTVDAIDGSAVIIERLRERMAREGLGAKLLAGDIVDLPYASETFDCVIDIACLMCNGADDTQHILDGVFDRMKRGGRLFSFSATERCWGAQSGTVIGENTYRDVAEGPFAGTGTARFSTKEQIERLYSRFGEVSFDISEYTIGGGAHLLSHWIIEGMKR